MVRKRAVHPVYDGEVGQTIRDVKSPGRDLARQNKLTGVGRISSGGPTLFISLTGSN